MRKIKIRLISAAVAGLLLGAGACHSPTAPGADGMSGLWLLPFGGGTVASLTQSGGAVSGFAHVIDSPVTCWDQYDRLDVRGSIGKDNSVRLTFGGTFPVEMTGVLSPDGTVLNNVHSISRSCAPGGYPWEETAATPGTRIGSISGTYEFRFEVDGAVRSFTATLSHPMTIGPAGEIPVTVSGSLGSGWPCAPRAVSSRDFYIMGYRLQGMLLIDAGSELMFVEVKPASSQWNEFQGTFSGSWNPQARECVEGFDNGSVTLTKR
ncbi:MAG: hypothetical protein ABFD52_01345 [Acidobacteriota bacterium]